MKFLFKSTVAMLMSGVTIGYVTIAYSVQWDWALAATRLIETISDLIT